MFCTKCGGEHLDEDSFCKYCGKPTCSKLENLSNNVTNTLTLSPTLEVCLLQGEPACSTDQIAVDAHVDTNPLLSGKLIHLFIYGIIFGSLCVFTFFALPYFTNAKSTKIEFIIFTVLTWGTIANHVKKHKYTYRILDSIMIFAISSILGGIASLAVLYLVLLKLVNTNS